MPPLTRRHWIATSSAAAAIIPLPRALAASAGPGWTVGCSNRPRTNRSYDEALDVIKAAGYSHTGLLTPTKADPFTTTSATPDYLAALKQKIAARGLKVNMTALQLKTDFDLPAAIADARKQLENGRTMGVEFALTFGESKPERYEKYFKIMADAAAFVQERGIKLVMKPHGGGSGAADEILTAMKKVGHPDFKIRYDAGSIIFYCTGKDPVAEFEPILPNVTGFCAKDCSVEVDAAGKRKPDVMIQFGAGEVDFAAVFKRTRIRRFRRPRYGRVLQDRRDGRRNDRQRPREPGLP